MTRWLYAAALALVAIVLGVILLGEREHAGGSAGLVPRAMSATHLGLSCAGVSHTFDRRAGRWWLDDQTPAATNPVESLLSELALGGWVRRLEDAAPPVETVCTVTLAEVRLVIGAPSVDGRFAWLCRGQECTHGVVAGHLADLLAPPGGFAERPSDLAASPTVVDGAPVRPAPASVAEGTQREWRERTHVSLTSLLAMTRVFPSGEAERICRPRVSEHWRLCTPSGALDEERATDRLDHWTALPATFVARAPTDPPPSGSLRFDDRPPLLLTRVGAACHVSWPGSDGHGVVDARVCDERLGSLRLGPAQPLRVVAFGHTAERRGTSWILDGKLLDAAAADRLDAALAVFRAASVDRYDARAVPAGTTIRLDDAVIVLFPPDAYAHGWRFSIVGSAIAPLRTALGAK